MIYYFYFLSFLVCLCAFLVIFSKNTIYSVLYFILTIFGLAGHYLLLQANFLVTIYIIVYAGAIMVLFLYTIMLLNLNKNNEIKKNIFLKTLAFIVGTLFFIILFQTLSEKNYILEKNYTSENIIKKEVTNITHNQELGSIKSIARILFKDYLLPFEISSLLLLVAVFTVVGLSKVTKENENILEKNK